MGVCRGTGDVIADFTASNKHYVYRQRKGGAFTSLHQKSIVERISADAEIFRNIKRLYWAILAMFVVVIAVQATAIYWRISISMELKDNTIDTLHGQELTRQNKELLEENQRLLHQLLKKQ
jgi:Na+/H+ antiporter NhaC